MMNSTQAIKIQAKKGELYEKEFIAILSKVKDPIMYFRVRFLTVFSMTVYITAMHYYAARFISQSLVMGKNSSI